MATGACLQSRVIALLKLLRSAASWADFLIFGGESFCSLGDLLCTRELSSYNSRIRPCLNLRNLSLIVWLTVAVSSWFDLLMCCCVSSPSSFSNGKSTSRSKYTWRSTAEPKTPGVPWCFEFFVPNIKHKGTPRILSKLLKPRTSLVFRGVLKPAKFFYVLKTHEHHGTPRL